MPKKIPSEIKIYIKRYSGNENSLSVRKISDKVKHKFGISISKSYVASILQPSGKSRKTGRKNEVIKYKRKEFPCGFIFLAAFSDLLGFFEQISNLIKNKLPSVTETDIQNYLKYIGLKNFLVAKNLLLKDSEIAYISQVSLSERSNIQLVEKVLATTPINIGKTFFCDKVKPVAHLKMFFTDGTELFCDPVFQSLYDKLPDVITNYALISEVRRKIKTFFKERVFYIGHIERIDSISEVFINFAQGVTSGINKIEAIDISGKTIETYKFGDKKLSFIAGYYPKQLNKKLESIDKIKYKSIHTISGTFAYTSIMARFGLKEGNKEIILNNFILKNRNSKKLIWGLLTNKRTDLESLFKRYFLLWPRLHTAVKEHSREKGQILSDFALTDININTAADLGILWDRINKLFLAKYMVNIVNFRGLITFKDDFCCVKWSDSVKNSTKLLEVSDLYFKGKKLIQI
ncbi:MAG: helix-turn-helix domain-containing protein [Candidatus Omnitrophica bacterium]|nr:helix-turn-helix domain-containing protein [Candidatus Omnitrophota bacterium]